MKKSEDMKQQLTALQNEAQQLINNDDATAEQVEAKSKEIANLKAKIVMQENLEADEKAAVEESVKNGSAKPIDAKGTEAGEKVENKTYENAFYNVLAGKRLTAEQSQALLEVNNALSSGTGEDGGYLIPADQQTAIKELKRNLKSAEGLVNIEFVSTLNGSRVIEKDAEHTPFSEFVEGSDVPESGTPQFDTVNYVIKDRGGILPIPNNLLADNTANLKAYINNWLSKKQIATRNKLIFDLLATKAKTPIADFDDIKNAFNVLLDPAIAAMSKVITNQSGYNWLDTQKDSDGKYLMQPMATDLTKKALFGLYPVEVFSDKTLKNDTTSGTKAPFIMGSTKEAVTLFDRQAMSLLATNIGGTAFGKNRTEVRAITREDVKAVDFDAIVYGQITITAAE